MSHCADRTEGRPDAAPAAAESTPPLCPHLTPALDELLRQGARVVAALPLAWSRVDLEVTLDSGAPLAELPAQLLAATIQTWRNGDAHYPLAQGLVCLSCRHSLGWPLQAGGTRSS